MRNAWAERTPRERWLILIAVLVVVGGVGYTQIWAPWQSELVRLRQAVETKTTDLAWMKQETARLKPMLAAAGATVSRGSAPITSVIENSARQNKLRTHIKRITPIGDEGARVLLDGLYFDDWLMWLEALQKNGVMVRELDVRRAKEEKVRVTVSFGWRGA